MRVCLCIVGLAAFVFSHMFCSVLFFPLFKYADTDWAVLRDERFYVLLYFVLSSAVLLI